MQSKLDPRDTEALESVRELRKIAFDPTPDAPSGKFGKFSK